MHRLSVGLPQVLLIEDSVFEQELLQLALADTDFDLVVAGDGAEGYALAKQFVPDLIILDVQMPKMDGLACCRLLQANPLTRSVPVIFLSGSSEGIDRMAGLDAGAVDFIGKPFHAGELISRIRIHLDLSRNRKTSPAPDNGPGDQPPLHDDDVLIIATQAIINSNLQLLPGLSDLARQVGTYRERFNQVFNRRLGISVFEYVRKRRVEKSLELLRETNLDVKQVARLVGFQNAANFATAFRAQMGATPRDYRKAWIAGDST